MVQGSENIFLVLDGQQRLKTLQSFYKGVFRERTFRLQYVQPSFQSLGYDDLDTDSRRRLDNSIIHATVVRQEVPSEDQSGIYKIFERLNTGGTLLQPQEIRVALFNGPLIRLLRELNEDDHWRAVCGRRSKRLKDQELILRFLAFRSRVDRYKAPMKEFLNDYTGWNIDLKHESKEDLSAAFYATTAVIHEEFGDSAFRLVRAVNAAVVDSLMTAVSEGINNETLRSSNELQRGYESLMSDPDYRGAVERATAREENVALRLKRARSHLLK